MSNIWELRQEEKEITRISNICWKGAIIAGLLASSFTFLSMWGLREQDKIADFIGKSGIAIFGAISMTGIFGFVISSIELEKIEAEIEKGKGIPPNCLICSYFSGNTYLPCAVRPELDENCKDWEAR